MSRSDFINSGIRHRTTKPVEFNILSAKQVSMVAGQADSFKFSEGATDYITFDTSTPKINMASDLDLTGSTSFTVGGASTLSSTLDVVGATTLSSTLGVTGAATLSNSLTLEGGAANGLIIQDGSEVPVTVFEVVGDSGNVSTSGNLDVTGSVGVDGPATLSSTLNVEQATTLASTLNVSGVSMFSNSLTLEGGETNGLIIQDGSVEPVTVFEVAGDSGNVTSEGTLNVTGATILSDSLGVSGTSTLKNVVVDNATFSVKDDLDNTNLTVGPTGAVSINHEGNTRFSFGYAGGNNGALLTLNNGLADTLVIDSNIGLIMQDNIEEALKFRAGDTDLLTFNTLNTGKVITFGSASNVIIDGNLTVNGTETILNTTTLEVEDNKILINSNYAEADMTNLPALSGMRVNRGSELEDFIFAYDKVKDYFLVGEDGSDGANLQIVATRDEDASMIDGGFISWNDDEKRLKTIEGFTFDNDKIEQDNTSSTVTHLNKNITIQTASTATTAYTINWSEAEYRDSGAVVFELYAMCQRRTGADDFVKVALRFTGYARGIENGEVELENVLLSSEINDDNVEVTHGTPDEYKISINTLTSQGAGEDETHTVIQLEQGTDEKCIWTLAGSVIYADANEV